ncbi:SDR family NAD(P)-dependent oxidoreductase [Jannaschia sp. M317]|uniref:SDR family NAD(P)-dependent oxidoreductase n=1 Tax=Jannaschia sp. M317 TaxID=2867011 RepID=UPI0021A93CB8|nr:SDR family oxidoreductase [Jannaschia sp. M317]UWQ16205.1 SDR family oxidoreductase [Jannaschia sp. M317]
MVKTAVVTGAARGIGLATTKLFLDAGLHVVMVDNDGAELAVVAESLENVTPHDCDVSDPASVARLAADVAELEIVALVNNAGLADFGPIEETTYERWRAVMATNLDGVFLMTQAFTPALKAAKGAVVNIASISALRASTLRVAYGTSKAGVAHLTQQQAVELGEHGIRVNCVCPGPVRTKLAMAVHTQDIIDAYHDAIPLNRYGQESEIAEAIVWLCSDKASFVTGQRLSVDGGFEATGIGLAALRS